MKRRMDYLYAVFYMQKKPEITPAFQLHLFQKFNAAVSLSASLRHGRQSIQ